MGRGGFVELGHFDKHFFTNTRKKVPHGNILEFLFFDTLKTENLRLYIFFDFRKRTGENSPPPILVPVSGNEYASWIPKYSGNA